MSSLLLLSCSPLAFACGSVLHRCAGGFIGTGSTFLARILWWALPTASFTSLLLQPTLGWTTSALAWLALTPALYLTRLIPHGWCQNPGFRDYLNMYWVSFTRGAILGTFLFPFSPFLSLSLPFLWAFSSSLGYTLGWSLLDSKELLPWHPANPSSDNKLGYDIFAKTGGEWSEVLTGGFIWLGLLWLLFPA